ncbi:general stress protein [Deinococcus sp. Arct2-2]|uniref:KGG domain-containing protein n=1 Tax=Deinococcus sp. Arct2-2 TaxID=2568653 RepID=UPI0010A4A935|nr:KGG domain-containing protein [Deinococcus sp. Arct2-2]THF71602.1 general stress protein [Deinococcus sp. Arct2-2]
MTSKKEKNSASSGRGFARMDPQRQREIASKGGQAAHASGNAHQFTSEEARAAGRKGGQASRGRTKADGAAPQNTQSAD